MSATETTTITLVGTWGLDPVHSAVGFEVGYLAGTFKGTFRDVSATLAVADDGRGALEGSARVASVDVKDENLSAHLQSPDFFDAERFPELRFTAEGVRLESGPVTVEGEITIRGVTRPITLTGTAAAPIDDPWGNKRLGVELRAAVDRKEFGLEWNNPLPSGDLALADEVTILADLQFVRAA